MKELYFSRESIETKTQEMLRKLAKYKQRHAERFVPGVSALLVLDMQNYFLDSASHAYIPSSQAILLNIQELIHNYSASGLPVVFTQHINTLQDSACMKTWWSDLITIDHPLSAISSEFNVSHGIVVQKNQYDAFYQTRLEEILHNREVLQVVICGVMTHLCCESTARSAFMRGFEVFFTVDGTATYNEAFHQASLLNLAHGFAVPVQVNDILAAFTR